MSDWRVSGNQACSLGESHFMKGQNIMNSWLKLIGSAKEPVTEWRKPYVGFRKENRPGIRSGDQLFFYAPGGSKCIFALAEATGDPKLDNRFDPNKEGSCRWKVAVCYPGKLNFPVKSGIPIDAIQSLRELTKSIRRASHIKLHPEESQSAYEKLRNKAGE